MVLNKGTHLYRYCLGDNAPAVWSKDYFSPEYNYPKYGRKNQIGAFFFYLDEQTARNVLGQALKNSSKRGESYPQNTITTCETIEDISLLDITGCDRPIKILNVLYDAKIDVLTNDFVRHLYGDVPFDVIRAYHQFIMEHENDNEVHISREKINYAAKIDDFFQFLVGYTGQLLTDFGNGVHFKRLLLEKGYEGYQFMEESSSPTICIFDSSKLSSPIHIMIK
jgi:hypothetical protein